MAGLLVIIGKTIFINCPVFLFLWRYIDWFILKEINFSNRLGRREVKYIKFGISGIARN